MEIRPPPPDDGFLPLVSSAEWGGRATRAEVHLDALAANVRAFRQLIGERSLMAVLKANAYGHGASMVARTALTSGAQWLGVYAVEEAVALREHGIEAPILVFGPFEPGEVQDIWRHRLTPTVAEPESAETLQRVACGPPLPVHLKLDTGMSRAGIAPKDAIDLMERLRSLPALRPEGIYTHFASADEPWNDLTHQQLGLFLQTVDELSAAGHSFAIKHAANSAGSLAFPETHLDMVRVGIGLYGYYPWREGPRPISLTPVLQLASRLTRVHSIPAGTGVGYGHEFRCKRDSIIGLVPIGYGDGLPRSLGYGAGTVIVRGRYAPIVGRVSMDQITIDVTDVPGVSRGDSVMLIGQEAELSQSADHLGDQAGTISYDVLTGLLPRVPRLYVRQGEVVGAAGLTPSPPLPPSRAGDEGGD